MNIDLTYQIAHHILSGLMVLQSDFVNQINCRALTDQQYLLPEKISFNDGDRIIDNNVYGCQMTFGGKEFKMILADCSSNKDNKEYCLFSQLNGSPPYCIYFNEKDKLETLIAVNSTKKFWMPCTIFIQATFLAGMENIKDVAYGWSKCAKYAEEYKQLKSFIDYHNSYCSDEDEEEENEGQEI
jgi:hypothetical protein